MISEAGAEAVVDRDDSIAIPEHKEDRCGHEQTAQVVLFRLS